MLSKLNLPNLDSSLVFALKNFPSETVAFDWSVIRTLDNEDLLSWDN